MSFERLSALKVERHKPACTLLCVVVALLVLSAWEVAAWRSRLWTAEASRRDPLAFAPPAAAASPVPLVPASTITVTTANDEDGTNPAACSLREAITAANTNHSYGGCSAGAAIQIDFIVFNIGSTPDINIAPLLGPLPTITSPVVIDGATGGATRVGLNGTFAGSGVTGLAISAGDSTIQSLDIHDFTDFGIFLGSSGNSIQNCLIRNNNRSGVVVSSGGGNTIGGTTAGTGNTIIGNHEAGVLTLSSSNQIQGNFIGTDSASSTGLGNGGAGVIISGGQANLVGGTTPGASNVISGNGTDGITINGSPATGNQIKGNFIGTSASGMSALKNNFSGVAIIGSSATNNTVGGTEAGARNIISGNGTQGVYLNAPSNTVQGNYIGTTADGLSALPNGETGIKIESVGAQTVNASGNTIGSANSNGRNVISGNGGGGLQLLGADATSILGNYIGLNAMGTAALGNSSFGVDIVVSSNCVIGGTSPGSGNHIAGNNGAGVIFNSGHKDTIQGNYIGTNAAGTAAIPNAGDGIRIISDWTSSTIGGNSPDARNVISGNNGNGIAVDGAAANVSSNLIQGNYIGTNAAGDAAIGNHSNGIALGGNSATPVSNVVGGTDPKSRNVISGNHSDGIYISTPGNQVIGNYIGTNAAGTAAIHNSENGVTVDGAANNVIGGTDSNSRNVISGNGTGIAIYSSGASNNTIQGNFVGTTADGMSALANSQYGLYLVSATNNTIGGTVTGAGNLISGNHKDGISLQEGAKGNKILGNLIGTRIDGNSALGNQFSGIAIIRGIGADSSNNVIGGTDNASRNIISANGTQGVFLNAGSNTILGNYIGTNISGTVALPNGQNGLQIQDADNNKIGGTSPGAGNLISGNAQHGINIQGSNSTNTPISGNNIGTKADGVSALGNTLDGLFLLGASLTFIGGGAKGPNVVAFNGRNGITIAGTSAANRNAVLTNSIYSNGALGIDLTPLDGSGNPIFGVTSNDPGDGDMGPNGLKNSPVLTSAVGYTSGSSSFIRVQGTLDTNDKKDNLLQIFANPGCDSSGYGEGKDFVGQFMVSVGAGGGALSFDQTLLTGIAFKVGDSITATATSGIEFDDTSEFSACVPLLTPTMAINDVSVTEANSGSNPANFTVTLTGAIGVTQPITVNYATANGTATAGSDYAPTSGILTFNPPFTQNTITQTLPIQVIGDTTIEPNETFFVSLTNNVNATLTKSQGTGTILDDDAAPTPTPTPTPMTIQFSSPAYTVSEGGQRVDIAVTRSGNTSSAAGVAFTTSDSAGAQNCNVITGVASSRCDYETRIATVQFAPGETSKTISVFIVDDSYLEGAETFNVSLSNPVGAALGSPSAATVTLTDNDIVNGVNPADTANFFVRLHYLDFLNREPDASGLNFWTNEITSCGTNQSCIDIKRINVSAAFFVSIEFQQTGYLVERIYKTAYGDATGNSTFPSAHVLAVPIVRLNEFLSDTQEIGQGVIVGQTGWETVLENNKQAFTAEFVQRSRFITALPTTMTPAQFVDRLFLNSGVTPTATERADAINEFGAAATTGDPAARGRALRRVAENPTLNQQEFNRAFVLMQFFGYLRRNPNDPQDTDYTGYDFWLTKLNNFNGDYVNAEMVKAFISSSEYRQRFGP